MLFADDVLVHAAEVVTAGGKAAGGAARSWRATAIPVRCGCLRHHHLSEPRSYNIPLVFRPLFSFVPFFLLDVGLILHAVIYILHESGANYQLL
jgi:hypothetical protein